MSAIKLAGIYAITCIINNKKYIGYSTSIKRRWATHKNELRKNVHQNQHLQAAWNKEGENMFAFTILELLPSDWIQKEYEKVEKNWVLKLKTHEANFGYNKCFPGSYSLRDKGQNLTNTKRPSNPTIVYVCFNTLNKTIHEILGTKEVNALTNIKQNKICSLCDYWKGIGKRKSLKNWMIIGKEDYDLNFDYFNFKKIKPKSNKTWKDYELTRNRKTKFTPYESRSIKRVPIISINISTGIEKQYPTIKAAQIDGFTCSCINKVINNKYGKYSHRGYYFKRA